MDVHIVLIDESTGAVIADSTVPLDSLPPTFEGMATTLTVAEAEYSVVHAEPASRDAIGKAGAARLTLRKVEKVDPKSILFGMPTLEDALPSSVEAPEGVEINVRLHEDEHRQVELVHVGLRAEVDAELAGVRRVLSDCRKGAGFTEVHVRKRLPAPLGGARVPVAELEKAVGAKARPFGIRGVPGMVQDGYAIPLSDVVVYGIAHDGVAATIAVYGPAEDVAGRLHAVGLAHGLLLVDWRRAEVLRALEEGWAV